jgi:hypothetical protein
MLSSVSLSDAVPAVLLLSAVLLEAVLVNSNESSVQTQQAQK